MIIMGWHKEWRKIAKKERRRRKRTSEAKSYEQNKKMLSRGDKHLCQDDALFLLELEQIEHSNKIENEKWLHAEKLALEQWQQILKEKEIRNQKQIEREAKLRMEWEAEQKKKIEEEERLRKIEEENKRTQQLFATKLEYFLSGDSIDPPEELLTIKESRPNCQLCPFFTKTACCRFGDQCSRNHQYPGISKVLLASNFYIHFGLDNANYNEYDTDVMLEYEESDTYKEFVEFFYDVLPEFGKFGRIVQFKVCNNYEKHLRGNTYVEFSELRCAVSAYQSLHSRWYGGRQLSLQFCNISSWKNAICGLQSKNRCPKGRACNFLHVFRNPNNMFPLTDHLKKREKNEDQRSSRSWRWSESPEPEIVNEARVKSRVKERSRDRSQEKEGHKYRSRRRSREHRKK